MMGIVEIVGLVTVAMPLIVQVFRFLDARIENEKYHNLRDGVEDIVLDLEEHAESHPQFYEMAGSKFDAAVRMAHERWPKVPVRLLKTLVNAVLRELDIGVSSTGLREVRN